MTHLSAVAWGRALLSADHWDDLQYGALLCHPQQQRGHLSRSHECHSTYLTIIHPGTIKVTIIKKVPSCNQLALPEFPFVRFFFFFVLHNILSRLLYHPVETELFLPPTWQSSTYICFYGHLDSTTNFNPHTVWVVSASFRTASILNSRLWEASARGSTVRTHIRAYTHKHTHIVKYSVKRGS